MASDSSICTSPEMKGLLPAAGGMSRASPGCQQHPWHRGQNAPVPPEPILPWGFVAIWGVIKAWGAVVLSSPHALLAQNTPELPALPSHLPQTHLECLGAQSQSPNPAGPTQCPQGFPHGQEGSGSSQKGERC